MKKIIYIFVLQLIILTNIYAKESTLATLTNILSNELQEFRISQNSFICKPYGIVTLEKLAKNADMDSTCRKSISEFYAKNPDLEQFSFLELKVMQTYHIEFSENECILYSHGQKTYSELLLENGLAVLKPIFKDEEFKHSFFKAQQRAKIMKKGMFKEKILFNCISGLYEK